jgi:hypothetical protein
MSPIGEHSRACNGAAQSLILRARAPQKLKPASGLQQDFGDEMPRQQDFYAAAQSSHLTGSGTASPVPFRHAPRLVAPFVAQLLGQLLPDCERPPSGAAMAYGAARIPTSLLLDARL